MAHYQLVHSSACDTTTVSCIKSKVFIIPHPLEQLFFQIVFFFKYDVYVCKNFSSSLVLRKPLHIFLSNIKTVVLSACLMSYDYTH